MLETRICRFTPARVAASKRYSLPTTLTRQISAQECKEKIVGCVHQDVDTGKHFRCDDLTQSERARFAARRRKLRPADQGNNIPSQGLEAADSGLSDKYIGSGDRASRPIRL